MPYKMNISNGCQKEMFFKMLRIRLIEEGLANAYREKEMRCPVHFCIGHEAIAVGVCQALRFSDTVMSNHRSHGHYLAKGGSLRKMVAELYGKSNGCTSGKGGSMHLIDKSVNFMGATSIVSGTIPVAVGIAFANKFKKKKMISAVFFGDAATEEGLFYESLNFAALHKLPVLFVCENNLYSVYSPLNVRQPASRKVYKIAQAMGLDSVRIDGNDIETVYTTTQKILSNIRMSKGPCLIEAMTYRWLEHCGPEMDNNLGYRSEKEFLQWKRRDPVAIYQSHLLNKSIITKKTIVDVQRKILKEIEESICVAKASCFPRRNQLTRDVYVC